MKLVGEYELTDDGVKIEGQIKDSKIHDVRKLLAPFKTARIFKGDVDLNTKVYHVPHPAYRPYVRKHLPLVCTPDTEKEYVPLSQNVLRDLEIYYSDATTFAHNMGIMYGDGSGRSAMHQSGIVHYKSLKRRPLRLLTNSAWVWTADERGNFKIEIEGMVNRHMMTMLISNATKMAKYIDDVLVKILDKPEEFTAEKILERSIVRRVLNPIF